MAYKLGSLFDGSGGFPLAGAMCGIEPVWAAEIEPYPIAVTRSRFPKMKHLGDISKINGAMIEPVDIITFGSPCQDLSVAGKRAGLKHEANGDEETTRSGLFMEAVRIIKEMREATNGEYPRYALWENVPGAFSSNSGNDFRIVLEELIRIASPDASMPPVPKAGWNYADSYTGDGWSLAYRVFDAQYWGVPQRRRRIHLITDFRGTSAREILFEREGLRGYFAEGRTPWQNTSPDAQGGSGADDRTGEGNGDGRGRQLDDVGIINTIGGNAENYHVGGPLPTLANGTVPGYHNAVAYNVAAESVPYTLKIRGGVDVDSSGKAAGKGALIQTDLSATLGTSQDQYLFQPVTDTHILDDQGGSVMRVRTDGKAPTLRAQMGGHPPVVMAPVGVDLYNCAETGDKAATLTTQGGGTASGPSVCYSINHQGGNVEQIIEGITGTITASTNSSGNNKLSVCYSVENHPADSRVSLDESGKVQTLTSRMGTGGGNVPMVMEPVVCMATQQGGAEIRTDDKAPTLTAAAGMSGNNQPVICLQGNGIDRADTAGCNGKGWREDAAYTLNTIDRPAVVYAVDQGGGKSGANVSEDVAPTLCTTHGGEPAVAQPVLHASKASFFTHATDGAADTLVATDYKDPQLVAYAECGVNGSRVSNTLIASMGNAPSGTTQDNLIVTDCRKPTNYIVRRLTPTECARLQGFADWWSYLEAVDSFSQKDYQFWLEVRHTHEVVVKGKDPKDLKDYTVKQMLTWYNKLWTDSAEYKMWGNGIALPPALYCMQGITDVLNRDEEEDSWML